MHFQVQSGEKPKVSEILAVRGLFSGPPLGIKRMSVDQMVSKSPPPHVSQTHLADVKCKRLVEPEYY